MDGIEKALTALVVDDNEVNRMILNNMLAHHRIRTEEADNGRKAVKMTEETAYDIIFVDHLMPVMDGIQTTIAIRKLNENKQDPIIIAITSDVTAEIRDAYLRAGANAVFTKPVELSHLSSLLGSFHLQNSMDQSPKDQTNYSDGGNELFKCIIETIDDIDYETGLKYAIGNLVSYRNILEVSLKELQACIIIIVNSYENNTITALKTEAHKLKNILASIGATGLSIEVSDFEKEMSVKISAELSERYNNLIRRLRLFEQSLRHALEKIKNVTATDQKKRIDSSGLMSEQEYEQCLTRAIYYIKRYEFYSIIGELEKLMERSDSDKAQLELAIGEIRNYNYDAALSRLVRIKNKTDQ